MCHSSGPSFVPSGEAARRTRRQRVGTFQIDGLEVKTRSVDDALGNLCRVEWDFGDWQCGWDAARGTLFVQSKFGYWATPCGDNKNNILYRLGRIAWFVHGAGDGPQNVCGKETLPSLELAFSAMPKLCSADSVFKTQDNSDGIAVDAFTVGFGSRLVAFGYVGDSARVALVYSKAGFADGIALVYTVVGDANGLRPPLVDIVEHVRPLLQLLDHEAAKKRPKRDSSRKEQS